MVHVFRWLNALISIANDVYIKANYPPYFFELDLFEAVNDEHSKVTTGEGYIRFQLIKVRF